MRRSIITRRTILKSGVAAGALLAAPAVLRAQTLPVFKIGALNSMTGPSQIFGPGMQKMIQAGAEIINAAGGAGGRRIEVVNADDQSLPEPAVLAAKKLVSVDNVQAIIGTLTSPVTLAVMKAVTLPNRILQTHVSGAEEIFTQQEGIVYKFGQAAGSYGRLYAKVADEMGFKNPVIMQLNNDSAKTLANAFATTWEAKKKKAPPRVVYDIQHPSYRSELQTALRNNPDVIILAAYLEDSAIIMREWYQTGIPTKFILAPYSLDAKLIGVVGKEIMEGVYFSDAVLPQTNPAYAEYDAVYRKVMNEPGSSNRFGAQCWDMMNVLGLAMEVAGPTATSAQIAAKFREVSNLPGKVVKSFAEGKAALKEGKVKYLGASSDLNFDENGVDTSSAFVLNVIENGAVKVVRQVTEA